MDGDLESASDVFPVILESTRPNCPFYGFHAAMGVMMDSQGNQCALAGGYSPCGMEIHNQEVNWNKCPYITSPSFKERVSNYDFFMVFPHETVDGFPLGEWMKQFGIKLDEDREWPRGDLNPRHLD